MGSRPPMCFADRSGTPPDGEPQNTTVRIDDTAKLRPLQRSGGPWQAALRPKSNCIYWMENTGEGCMGTSAVLAAGEQPFIELERLNFDDPCPEARGLREQHNIVFLRYDRRRHNIDRRRRISGSCQGFVRTGFLKCNILRYFDCHHNVVKRNLVGIEMDKHLGQGQRRLLGSVDDGSSFVITGPAA